jgi:hypothetical protein
VGDEHECLTGAALLSEHVGAFLGERGVTDGEDLVDEHYVGVGLHHDREGEADHHARGVVLELEVLELLEFGELDHAVVAPARLARRESHHDPVHHDVVTCGQIRVEPHAELDERRQAPAAPNVALAAVDPGDALEQCALSAPVATRDPEELAGLDGERDVVERSERLVADPPARMQHSLLESVHPLLWNPERLADATRNDRGQAIVHR